jgi:hypothetical protein
VRAIALVVVAGCTFHASDAPPDSRAGDADAGSTTAWWDVAFAERLPIAITNGSSVALPGGFQVGLAYDVTGAPCSSIGSDHDDVRIVFGSDTELTRIIDDVGPPAWTWFQLQVPGPAGTTTPAGDYWLYCDNPSAGAAPAEPNAVFGFFDAFDALGPAWEVGGDAAVVNGQLACGGDETQNDGVTSTAVYPAADTAIDFVAAETGSNDFWWGGLQVGAGNVAPWALWYANLDPHNELFPSFAQPGVAEDLGSGVPQNTTPHLYGVESYGQVTMFRLADVPVSTLDIGSGSGVPASYNLRLWNGGGNANAKVLFDSVRTRTAVNPPPTTQVGRAEQLPP